jgi:hypothetical protein
MIRSLRSNRSKYEKLKLDRQFQFEQIKIKENQKKQEIQKKVQNILNNKNENNDKIESKQKPKTKQTKQNKEKIEKKEKSSSIPIKQQIQKQEKKQEIEKKSSNEIKENIEQKNKVKRKSNLISSITSPSKNRPIISTSSSSSTNKHLFSPIKSIQQRAAKTNGIHTSQQKSTTPIKPITHSNSPLKSKRKHNSSIIDDSDNESIIEDEIISNKPTKRQRTSTNKTTISNSTSTSISNSTSNSTSDPYAGLAPLTAQQTRIADLARQYDEQNDPSQVK